MTVNYSMLMSSQGVSTFFRLLLRWRGSVFKVIYKEGLIYFACWTIVSLTYRLALDPAQQLQFESLILLCRTWQGMIPVTFILGFYVSVVFNRWMVMVNAIPWLDETSFLLSYITPGSKPDGPASLWCPARAIVYRRSIVRYIMAGQVLALRAVSLQVKARFPSLEHIVAAKLLTPEEGTMLSEAEAPPGDTKHWLPLHWAANILHKARRKGHIASDVLLDAALRQVNKIRGTHGFLIVHDWINVPLVYTQLVTISVWAHFGVGLFGFQWVRLDTKHPLLVDKEPPIDLYVPIFTTLQFIAYVGWLRVASSMLNPLGVEDDDLELNAVMDQNLQKGMAIADSLYGQLPTLGPDDLDEGEMPHTLASLPFAAPDGIVSSAAEVEIPEEQTKPISAAASVESGLHSNLSSNHSRVSRASIRSRLSKVQASLRRSITDQMRSKTSTAEDPTALGGGTGLGSQLSALDEVAEEEKTIGAEEGRRMAIGVSAAVKKSNAGNGDVV